MGGNSACFLLILNEVTIQAIRIFKYWFYSNVVQCRKLQYSSDIFFYIEDLYGTVNIENKFYNCTHIKKVTWWISLWTLSKICENVCLINIIPTIASQLHCMHTIALAFNKTIKQRPKWHPRMPNCATTVKFNFILFQIYENYSLPYKNGYLVIPNE